MPRTAFNVVSPMPTFDRLPVQIQQLPASGVGPSRLLLLLPAVAALTGLLASVGVAAAGEPSVFDALAQKPLASMQIAAGIGLWALLFVVPASKAISALWRRREVSVDRDIVVIKDCTLLRTRTRHVPLSTYHGIAHHIRASLSGLTHEIILVHADPACTVTLASADKITQQMLDDAKALFRLPEVPARLIYERGARLRATGRAPTLDPARA